MSVSVLILTLDEEQNLPGCLASLEGFDDVVVLDSCSRDRTVEIAQARGARVSQRRFDDYAAQRNHGLRQIRYRYPWVLMLDADERLTPELRAEIEAAVATADEAVAMFRVRRRDYFLGRWLRRSSGYPTWFGRLVRVGRAWVERPINEEFHCDGESRQLQEHLDHHPYNKGFSNWLVKHDRYSTMEAAMLFESGGRQWTWRELFAREATLRRRAQKALIYGLPGRSVMMFCALYFVRGGILEGRAGLIACLLRAFYEFMIDCKLLELRRRAQSLPV